MNTLNQEADMGYVRDFVAKVAEALVAATELPKQIEAIKAELVTLNSDLDHTKQRNIELDTALNDTRRQRDEAEQALSQVKSELTQVTSQKDFAEKQAVSFQAQIASLQDGLNSVKKERDDYGMKQMEAEERASQAEAKLAKLAEALGLPKPEAKPNELKTQTFGTVTQIMPTDPTPSQSATLPVPEPAKYYQDVAKEATAKVEELTKSALSQSAPQAELKRIYDTAYNYKELASNVSEHWDDERRQYYIEV